MKGSIFSVLFTILSIAAFAQGRQIEIRSSELVKGFQAAGFVRIIRPVFVQEGSTLASDSADFNQSANTFQAFGHVVITQPSGTTIYSDLLNYDGNSKLAILTNNVRLIDGDATLTTNLLTYNMATRIGTYNGGGKIVNGNNVLTSKNGYYFSASRDAYFRYDVVLTSPDALINTDTLRYNSTSKIAYFYGPTNIYGEDDTLYTENGTYNTVSDQARFGKNNLYTQGSKSLKGDSLFYDRKAGFGKAIGNITFIDTAENALLRGGIGVYQKSDESILVTKNPYVVIISESDSAKVDSIWLTADTLFSKVVFVRDLIPYQKEEFIPDDEIAGPAIQTAEGPDVPADPANQGAANASENMPAIRATIQKQEKKSLPDKNNDPPEKEKPSIKADTIPVLKPKKTEGIKTRDSIQKPEKKSLPDKRNDAPEKVKTPIQADTIPVLKPKKTAGINTRDTIQKPEKKSLPDKSNDAPEKVKTPIKADTIPVLKPKKTAGINTRDTVAKTASDTIKTRPLVADSALADTSRTRIVIAYHKAKIFKSDLQARADSMFFSYSDSTVRCFVNPMIWAQGSQLSGDTVYLQMKNKKLDNMLLQHSSFIVNTESADSINFNQIKGKVITGYFRDNKLNSMFVDGNAESVYYLKDDTTYSGLNHLVSSRLKVLLKENKLQSITAIRSIEASITPMDDLQEEDKILKGFIWKPRDRPKSKEEIIPQLAKKESKPGTATKSQPKSSVPKPPLKSPAKAPEKTAPKVPAKTPVRSTQN